MAEHSSRVLIADDNKVNRLLLSRSVELLGHRCTLAENGRLALERLRSEAFDLVRLDIEMPELMVSRCSSSSRLSRSCVKCQSLSPRRSRVWTMSSAASVSEPRIICTSR
jgi:DNA-binding response OmpR family regulator